MGSNRPNHPGQVTSIKRRRVRHIKPPKWMIVRGYPQYKFDSKRFRWTERQGKKPVRTNTVWTREQMLHESLTCKYSYTIYEMKNHLPSIVNRLPQNRFSAADRMTAYEEYDIIRAVLMHKHLVRHQYLQRRRKSAKK